MAYSKISFGRDLENDLNIIIEIPAGSSPIKYEVDKDTEAVWVDRFIATPMFYPADYGYIPGTLCGDGDPLDALVICPHSLLPGVVIRARPLGVLFMSDESGQDEKLICVPISKLTKNYDGWQEVSDVPEQLLNQIQHYFEHYKDLEKGKFVKIDRWGTRLEAIGIIKESIERANSN